MRRGEAQSVTEFLLNIIPSSVIGAFAGGSILSVIFVSVLFGFALASLGPRVKPLLDMLDGLTQAVFGVVNIVMRAAPIGAFGAMAFTVGRFGLSSLGPLALYRDTLRSFRASSGGWARRHLLSRFQVFTLLKYIREEIILPLFAELLRPPPGMRRDEEKLERLGCSKALAAGHRRKAILHPEAVVLLPCGLVRRPGDKYTADPMMDYVTLFLSPR